MQLALGIVDYYSSLLTVTVINKNKFKRKGLISTYSLLSIIEESQESKPRQVLEIEDRRRLLTGFSPWLAQQPFIYSSGPPAQELPCSQWTWPSTLISN